MKSRLDRENPWPGLDSFRSIDAEFFRGRDRDRDDLLQEIRRARLVTLYGASGLGKTSLVHAGLSPLLAGEGLFLVPIRLAYKPESPTIARQILDDLGASRPDPVRMADPRADETVWEYLHRRDPAVEGLEPLLFFDQFEELFTIGAGSARAIEARDELKALIEGAPPPRVRLRLDAQPDMARSFSFQHHPYRVLLGIREDFVSKLESLSPEIPSIIHHRVGLLPLNGETALEVVMQPPRATASPASDAPPARPALVERPVAELIVRTVASAKEPDATPLADLEVEPALLSLFCSELNRMRQGRKQARSSDAARRTTQGPVAGGPPEGETSGDDALQITADMVAGSRTEIISGFYERALADVAPTVRAFIEDKLVTEMGYRTSAVQKEALAIPGFTQAVLDDLVNRRLLRVFERARVLWVEITHDVLTGVVATSRDARRESERKAHRAAEEKRLEEKRHQDQTRAARRRRWVLGAVLLGVFFCYAAGVEWQAASRARRAAREQALQLSLATRHHREALAQLALKVREESGATAARLLMSDILRRQNWPLPFVPMFPEGPFTSVTCAPEASRCAAAYRDGRVLVRGDLSLRLDAKHDGYAQLRFSRDGTQLLFIPEDKGTGIRWKLPSPEPLPFASEAWDSISVSEEPLSVILSSGNTIVLHVLDTGKRLNWAAYSGPSIVTISRDGRWAAYRDSVTTVALIDVQTGSKRILARQASATITQIELAPHGDRLAVGMTDGRVALWQITDASLVDEIQEIQVPQAIDGLAFQPNGDRLAASLVGGGLWLWSKPWDKPSMLADWGAAAINLAFSPNGNWFVASRRDGTVGVWDTASGTPLAADIQHQTLAFATPIDEARLLTASLDGDSAAWSLPRRTTEASINLEKYVGSAWFVGENDIHADAAGVSADWTGGSVHKTPTLTQTIFSRDRRFRASLFTNSVHLETIGGEDKIIAGSSSTCSAFSRDGTRFLTVIDGTARLWDSAAKTAIGGPVEGVTSAWLNHDGKLLVTKGSSPGLAIRSVAQNGSFSAPEILGGYVYSSVAFDQKAERLLLASENRARVWSRREKGFLGRPIVHNGSISYADFSADGAWVVTTAADKTARIWEAATGEPVSDWLLHDASVTSADFSPSGHRLLTATAGGRLQIWQVLSGAAATPEQNDRLARLAEIVGGLRIDLKSKELVPTDRRYQALSELRTEIGDGLRCDSTNFQAQKDCTPAIDDLIQGILAKR